MPLEEGDVPVALLALVVLLEEMLDDPLFFVSQALDVKPAVHRSTVHLDEASKGVCRDSVDGTVVVTDAVVHRLFSSFFVLLPYGVAREHVSLEPL